MGKTIKPFLLFAFIFTVFFSSAAGLYNSGDAPQFFTTEAILKNGSLNLAPFRTDPHWFIWPDFYEYRGQVLSYRGYMTSVLSLPLHLLAGPASSLLGTGGFDPRIVTGNFPYELAVSSLFTLFSVFGLGLAWRLAREAGAGRMAAGLAVVLFALGTYIWKYSAFESRHGETVFILSLFLYSLFKTLKGNRGFHFFMPALLVAVACAIDLVLFVSLGAVALCLYGYLFFRKERPGKLLLAVAPGAALFVLVVALNWFAYGSISSVQSLQSFQFDSIPMAKRLGIATSAPLASVLPVVLFNAGKIPEAAFAHFSRLPETAARFTSLEFARKYDFWGMFFISPFLLFSFFVFLIPVKREVRLTVLSAFLLFCLNVGGNSTFYAFWGGNQYDIRYFYPYAVLLFLPFALVLKGIGGLKNRAAKGVLLAALALSSAWGIYMGWLGVMGMFGPSLTGERRIWTTPFAFPAEAGRYTATQLLGATFPNGGNFLAAVFLAGAAYGAFLFLTSFSARRKTARQNSAPKPSPRARR